MITNGTIRYLKRVRTGDFQHDEAQADISFVVSEGQDGTYAAAEARGLAVNEVFRALGLLSDGMTVAAPETPPPPTSQPAPVKRERKTAVKDPLAPGAAAMDTSEAKNAADGSAVTEERPQVSDSDLTSFVARRNDELIAAFAAKQGGDGRAGTALLRDVIAKYSTSIPASVRGIPQEKRYAFMGEVKKLNAEETAHADA